MTQRPELLESREVFFAVILVRDSSLSELPPLLAKVVDCALQCGGDILSFDVAVALVVFGMSDREQAPEVAYRIFVGTLMSTMGADVSVVHGRRSALVGAVGAPSRKSFTTLFAGYRELLRELVNTPLGFSKEI